MAKRISAIFNWLILPPVMACLFFFGAIMVLQAATTFVDSNQLLGNSLSYDVALGDLDGDADLDAFVANFGFVAPEANRVWLNNGSAVFTGTGQSLGNQQSYAVALGNLDGDTDLDAFVANYGYNRVWSNNGAAVFTDSGQLLGSNTAATWDVALGDLDGDTDLDAFAVNFGAANEIYFNNGFGLFTTTRQLPGVDSSAGVALGDLDGDTDFDALVGNYNQPSVIWLNDGSGYFTSSNQLPAVYLPVNGIALGDLDGDHDLDAVIATSSSNPVWFNNGHAVFTDTGQSLGNSNNRQVKLADVDADGDLDALFSGISSTNQLWFNNGSGIFTGSVTLGGFNTYGLDLTDLDGDTDLDIFMANYGAFNAPQPNRVWLNQSPPPNPQADIGVKVSGAAAINLNSFATIVHGGVISSSGPATATNVIATLVGDTVGSISYTPPAGCTVSTFPTSQTCTFSQFGPNAAHPMSIEYTVSGNMNPLRTYQQRITSRFSAGSDTTDPNPDNNAAAVHTEIFNCDNSSCWLERLFCVSSFSPGLPSLGALDVRASSVMTAASLAFDLPLYYRVRDEILAGSADGQHYTNLYYTHNAEITTLVLSNTTVMAQALHTLQTWEPNLRALVEGQGDSVVITAGQIQAMDDFLQLLSLNASPALQQAIATERARLPTLTTFIGMSMSQARSNVIGHGVYLPIIIK